MRRHLAAAVVWTLLVAGLFAGQPPQPAAPQLPPRDTRAAEVRPAAGRAVLRGQILAADSGQPLSRATIIADGHVKDGRHRAAISTNGEGRYELAGLPAGQYNIIVRRAGYLDLGYGQRVPRERAAMLDVADGAVINLDFRLPRMSVVSGRITDELGEPIANAVVNVIEPERLSARQPARSAPTDADGQYRVAGLGPGQYVVFAQSNETWRSPEPGDTANIGYARTYFPGAFSSSGATPVTLGLGQEVVNLNFSLLASRLATITGTAFDSMGAPLQGLMLMTEDLTSAGGAVLAGDGTFRVTNVRPGRYILRGGARSELVTMPLEINGADVEGVSIRSGPGWSLSGRVIVDPAARTSLELTRVTIQTDIETQSITGAFTSPLPGVFQPAGVGARLIQPTIREGVFVVGPATGPGAPASARPDPEGRFRVTPIFGPSLIGVSLPPGWVTSSITAADRDLIGAVLELASGAELPNVDLVVTDRTGAVSGRVVDGANAPVTVGTVIVFSENQARWLPWTGAVRETQPDAQGAFRIDSLLPGRYAIAAVDYIDNFGWLNREYLRALLTRAERVDVAVDAQVSGISLRIVR